MFGKEQWSQELLCKNDAEKLSVYPLSCFVFLLLSLSTLLPGRGDRYTISHKDELNSTLKPTNSHYTIYRVGTFTDVLT